MKKKEVRVAIIDNSIDRNIYDPIRHWTGFLNIKWESFRAKKNDFPEEIEKDFTHVLLTGSEASIMDRPDWVIDEIEFVKETAYKKIPIMGSCYGHQMIALALEGPQCVQRSSFPEIGWIPIKISKDNLLLGNKGIFYSFSIHFDEVIGLSSDFEILASTEPCPIQAFQKRGESIWGIQSHPEISPSEGKTLLKNLIKHGKEPLDIYKKVLNSVPKDSEYIDRIIDTFINY